jgi:hypothetical protein
VPKPNTTYANVVNVRSTPTELVLDFGLVMEGEQPPGQLEQLEPEVRVIMSIAAARRFGEALLHASEEHERASLQHASEAPEQKRK